MGGSSSRATAAAAHEAEERLLSPDERVAVRNVAAAAGSTPFLDDWPSHDAAGAVQRVVRTLARSRPAARAEAEAEAVVLWLALVTRGSAARRADLLVRLAAAADDDDGGADAAARCDLQHLQQHLRAFVDALDPLVRRRRSDQGAFGGDKGGALLLAGYLCSGLKADAQDGRACAAPHARDVLARTTLAIDLVAAATSLRLAELCTDVPPSLGAPGDRVVPQLDSASHLLSVADAAFLASLVPQAHRLCWRRLYASESDGNSFTQFWHGLLAQGPTIIVVEEVDDGAESRHLFGGYAADSWKVHPSFFGAPSSFLFRLRPAMSVHGATGYNANYQYLNVGAATLPNGLGMGGQLSYCGLWIDAGFSHGHSKARPTSTTFGSPQLSRADEFRIRRVEAWAVGPRPSTEEGEGGQGGQGVLNVDPQAAELLEMAGKKLYSKHLRERPPE